MFRGPSIERRKLAALIALALVAGCKAIPKREPAPVPVPTPEPSADALPTDADRHRIALLVPMTGANNAVGQAIANAANMALMDTNAQNLRVTTYDTGTGAAAAAQKAIADGNALILGPLTAAEIPVVASAARAAKVPLISFSNDETAAARDVFVMGSLPSQSIVRSVSYARAQGAAKFAALVPGGEYGTRAVEALQAAVREGGGTFVASESYDRSNTSVTSAARRLRTKGGFDAVLVADSSRFATQAAPLLRPAGANDNPRILGTELWTGESAIASAPAMRGALFSAVSDARFRQFSDSYRTRFGAAPYRIATLGYDAVLLTLRITRDWRAGRPFPMGKLTDSGGFLGLDGAFRFRPSGVIERALEVREVGAGGVSVVSPAPARFAD